MPHSLRARLLVWLLAALALTGWFLFSAAYLYGLVPESVLREALRSLAERVAGKGFWGDAEAIFMNNLRVLLLDAVPILGVAASLATLAETALVGRYAAMLLARLLGGSWWGYFLRLVVATPFFPIEMLAYGIALSEGLMVLKHRSLRRYLAGVGAAVLVLAVAALVEAYAMTTRHALGIEAGHRRP